MGSTFFGLRGFAIAVLVTLPSASTVWGQTRPPNRSGLTLQGPAEQSVDPVVRDALGRPCLDIEAAAVPHVVDPQMLDHVVSIRNKCPRVIKAKVCYFNSQACNELTLQPYKRADTILGTMRAMKFFRYSIQQR